MYAIKGVWVGQTFALASSNESGGRKTRIRRSKEERKEMVESFIKMYQSSNDGKFPSLNLTHKEVGGSFYTVREIVRDVIQENRVLGPAKFSSEEQRFDSNTREFPLQSATQESQDHLFQLEIENPSVLDQEAAAIMELNVNRDEQYANHEVVYAGESFGSNATEESDKLVYVDSLSTGSVGEKREHEFVDACTDYHGKVRMELNILGSEQLDKHQELDVKQAVNCSPDEESDKAVTKESSVGESFQVKTGVALRANTGRQNNATFELNFSDNEQMNKHEGLDFGINSKVEESNKLDHVESLLIEKNVVDRSSGLVEAHTTKLITPTDDIVVETFPLRSISVDIYTFDTALDDSRGLNGEVEKKCVNSGNDGAVLEKMDTSSNASEPVILLAANDSEASSFNREPFSGHETIGNAANNLLEVEDPSRRRETTDIEHPGHNNPAVESHNKSVLLKTADELQDMTGAKARGGENTVFPNNFNGVKSGSNNTEALSEREGNEALKGRKPTLDRINLESWEDSSKKWGEHERNPLLVFIKSLVSGFMKFWSE